MIILFKSIKDRVIQNSLILIYKEFKSEIKYIVFHLNTSPVFLKKIAKFFYSKNQSSTTGNRVNSETQHSHTFW